MALPSTIAGLTWSPYRNTRHGPFEHNGNLYIVGVNTGASVYEVRKSTDGGQTWTAVGTGPSMGSSPAYRTIDVQQVGAVLHIAYFTTTVLYAITFDCATDSWGSVPANGVSGINTLYSITNLNPIHLAARSDGSTVVAHQTSFTSMGKTGRRAVYSIFSGGAWIGPFEIVTDADATVHYDIRAAILGASDRVHFFYTSSASTNLLHKSLTGTTLSAQVTVGAAATAENYPSGIPTLNGSELVVPTKLAGGGLVVYRAMSTATPTFASQAVTATAVESLNANPAAVAMDGTTAHIFFVGDANQNVWRDSDAGTGTWGTDTRFGAEAGPVNGINAGKVTGAVGILYNNNGVVTYDAYSLGPPPAASHPLTAAVVGTSAASATQLRSGNPVTAAIVGTSTSAAVMAPPAVLHPLTAAVTATSTTAATKITVSYPLATAITGSSAATATRLTVSHPITAAATGTSSVVANMAAIVATHPLTATVAGTSAGTATTLGMQHPLAGAVAGTSAANATAIMANHPLTTTVSGTSAATASRLITSHPLTATATATSTVAATQLTSSHPLTASAIGTSASTATMAAQGSTHPLTSAIAGTSAAAATTITLQHPLSATAVGTSSASATRISMAHPLTAEAISTSSASATITPLGTSLTASLAGTSDTLATLLRLSHPMTAAAIGGASLAAALYVEIVDLGAVHATMAIRAPAMVGMAAVHPAFTVIPTIHHVPVAGTVHVAGQALSVSSTIATVTPSAHRVLATPSVALVSVPRRLIQDEGVHLTTIITAPRVAASSDIRQSLAVAVSRRHATMVTAAQAHGDSVTILRHDDTPGVAADQEPHHAFVAAERKIRS